jgi:hypothetical protein
LRPSKQDSNLFHAQRSHYECAVACIRAATRGKKSEQLIELLT